MNASLKHLGFLLALSALLVSAARTSFGGAIHQAIKGYSPRDLKLILQTNAAVINSIDDDGFDSTPLHVAAMRSDLFLQPLLDAGAKLELTNNRGETALACGREDNSGLALDFLFLEGQDQR